MSTEQSQRPLRRDAERNGRRVVGAARELFGSKGLQATLNEVAHHARVGVGTVYRRFPDKYALIDAAYAEDVSRIATFAETGLRQADSWQGFVFFVEQACDLVAIDKGLREVVFNNAPAGDRVDAARHRIPPLVSKVVERAKKDGHLCPELSPIDTQIFGLFASVVHEHFGHANVQTWRPYLARVLDSLRRPSDNRNMH